MRADACPKADYPSPIALTNRSQELSQREGRSYMQKQHTFSTDSHLELGHWWSDQHHLDCFRYS